MSIKTSILIEANGQQAKGEIEGLEKAVKKTGAATEDMGRKARTGATGTRDLGGAAGQTEAKVESLAAAERRAATAAGEMERANRRASGATANLVAQGNDIMVMLAAGQSPMQLALQQGTQINQVFAQLGGGMAAVKGVGSALMAMVSPMSLLTIGTIAGVSALTNWVMGAINVGEEAGTVTERMDRLSEGIDNYAASAEAARAPTDEIIKKFGNLGNAARTALKEVASADLQSSLARVQDQLDGIAAAATSDLGRIQTNRWSPELDAGRSLSALQRGIADADGPDAQVAALQEARDAMAAVVAEGGKLTDSQQEFLSLVNQTIVEIARLKAIQEQVSTDAWKEYYASRIANEERLAQMRANELTAQAEIYGLYSLSRAESDAALSDANDMLAALQAQSELKALVAQYGADSLQVAQYHVDAEREVQQALVDSLDVSDSLKVELMAAWDAANGISAADMASGIGSAADQAARLAENLRLASLMSGSPGLSAQLSDEDAAMNVPVLPGASGRDRNRNAVDNLIRLTTPRSTASGRKSGGGGKSDTEKARDDAIKAAEREQKAVDSLIGSLREEVDVQRLLDPVQQEMRRHRDTLASATSAERAEVEKLITTREAEATAMAAAKEQMDFFKSSGFELFDDLTDGAGGFGDSLESIADRIRQIALEALLLGEGPLAGLLGGGNAAGGGLLGMAAKALIPGMGAAATGSSLSPNVLGDGSLYADGGLIHGPGGGRSDDVPIWASNGEFMMTAKATAQYRHLLEAMNAGAQLPGFATGGAIDGSRAASMMAPQITFVDQSTGAKTMTREDSIDAQGRPQTKFALADAVGQALTTKGGGAQRVLRRGFGLRPVGSKR